MELHISHALVTKLTALERIIATLPKSAQYIAFYRKQARDTQITDILAVGSSMELMLSPNDAKTLLESSEHGTVQQSFRLLKNTLAVMRYAKSVREHTFTSAILQHENKLLSDGFTDFWEEGKVRAPHEVVLYTHDGLRNRVVKPNYQLWTDIRQMLSYPDKNIHPVLLAAMTAYHLAYSYPFGIFTLQTALLAGYTLVRPTPYWVSGTTSVMGSIWKTLQRTDFTFDPTADHYTQFVDRVVTEFSSQAETILDALEHQSSIPPAIRASLNDRQLKVLTYFKQHKKLSRKKYAIMMDIAIATAFRDLSDLATKGLIKSVGQGRGTSYILANIPRPGELPNLETNNEPANINEELEDYE